KHTHITKAKSNQRFTVVEAESKEEAKEKYEVQVKRDAVESSTLNWTNSMRIDIVNLRK
ncbi:TPA: DUF1381 domain-containing protein, partial [Staphylococcus aureus]|nr:DUF1381 domain-containing protein [Staphylococcus aureus]